MKYKVIFLEGLSQDELKSLDDALAPLNKNNRADFFARFFGQNQELRAVYLDVRSGQLQSGDKRDARDQIAEYPEKYIKAVPQFEVKIVAKLKLPFPEEIEEHGQRYRLVQE